MLQSHDHPQRYPLVNELHARPFPRIEAPARAVFVAIKEPVDAANRNRDRDRAHLLALLDRHGVAHPQPGATHYSGQLGRNHLKWESHTEFVTYSAFCPGLDERPFDPATASIFSDDWLAQAPGKRLCSVLVRIDDLPDREADLSVRLEDWFVPESTAAATVLDGAAVVAGDFRIDPAGHMRFAVFARPGIGSRRVGRVVQRLCEIETYRAMSMLGLNRAREVAARLNGLDPQLTELVKRMDGDRPEETLHELLRISAELEALAVAFSFRAGATKAYEAIVQQRIEALRETRFAGRQTFGEFMTRRYDPAMRTVKSVENRLKAMVERSARAAELLRTRVDVDRSAQNQLLLESMDRRADLQLRLQRTVEGLSVVAISYYAVGLAANMVAPLAEPAGLGKGTVLAVLTPLVVLLVWVLVRRLRRHFD
ncbi:MAG: DUF3422 family protein [Gemmobacter sp.]